MIPTLGSVRVRIAMSVGLAQRVAVSLAQRERGAERYPDGGAIGDTDGATDPRADSDAHRDTGPDANPYAGSDSDAHGDPDPDPDRHATAALMGAPAFTLRGWTRPIDQSARLAGDEPAPRSSDAAERLVALIEGLIADGTFPPGSRLPPERELGRQFDVGRSTLRLALADLEARGVVDRHQGRGTFIARPRIDADATQHFTLSAALRATGGVVRTETLSNRVVEPGRAVARDLGLPDGGEVIRIERLRRLETSR